MNLQKWWCKERTVSPLLKRRAAVSELCKKRAVRGLLKKFLKAKQHFSNSPLTALSLHTSLLSVRHLRRGLLALSLEASLKSFLVVFGSQATQCVKVISCFGLNLETSQADLACYHGLFLPGIYLTDWFGLGVCQTLWSQGGRPCFVSTAVASYNQVWEFQVRRRGHLQGDDGRSMGFPAFVAGCMAKMR